MAAAEPGQCALRSLSKKMFEAPGDPEDWGLSRTGHLPQEGGAEGERKSQA